MAGAVAAAAIALPALGFALGPIFEEKDVEWQPVGDFDDFRTTTYVPKVITTRPRVGVVGKTTVYMRRYNEDIDTEKADDYNRIVALSTRCMHLGCPVRYTEAAQRFICPCHGGVYDFRGKVDGGPPVRPLDRFYTRVRNGQVEVGPRFSVNSELRAASPAIPARIWTASASTCTPVASDPAQAARNPSLMPKLKLPAPPLPSALQPRPARPGESERVGPIEQAKEAGISAVDWVDERTSLSGGARWAMFRKVPKGTNWFYTLGSATMFAFLSQAITGVFLAMYYARRPTRPTSRRATSPTRSSSASSCAACTSGARR